MQNSGQLLFLAVIAVFLVWTLSRGRRQQRETQMTQSRVRPGAEVMMSSGVYGTVLEVGEDGTLRLETSPGIVSRWDRRAVARVVTSPDEETEPEAPASAGVDEPPEAAESSTSAEPARPTQDVAPPDRD